MLSQTQRQNRLYPRRIIRWRGRRFAPIRRRHCSHACASQYDSARACRRGGNKAYDGKMVQTYGIAGIIGSLFGGLPLYWFGCLFERVEQLQTSISERKLENRELRSSIKDVFKQNDNMRISVNEALSNIENVQTSMDKFQTLYTNNAIPVDSDTCKPEDCSKNNQVFESHDQTKADPVDSRWIPADLRYVNCPNCGMHMSLDYIKIRKKCPNCNQEYSPQQI